MDGEPLLVVDSVSKSFGPTHALSGVSFRADRGLIVGLAGENGAGKSTLIKILCGVHRPDSGTLRFDGRPYRPRNPEDAERTGISVFHQEIPICPHLSIAANVFLGPDMPRRGISPDWKAMNARCRDLYRDLLGEEIDPARVIGSCTAAEKQLALLVRVLSREAKLVVLDEPTTALAPPEVERLFAIIRRLRERGIGFVFVSHMLEELTGLCDRIDVFRDGKVVGRMEKAEFDIRELSRLIAGRELTQPEVTGTVRTGEVRFAARNVSRPGAFEDVSFSLAPGEILGLAGLQGSGRSELARAVFGYPPVASGELVLDGRSVRISSPADAVGCGIGYVPEDRKTQGLFHERDIKTNMGIAVLGEFSRRGTVDTASLREAVAVMRTRIGIKMEDPDAVIGSLSGGNQQKVLISRWLLLKPRLLVMNEPTRGVDVGAKQEIAELIRNLAAAGCSFIISSPELEELMALADRIVVMNRGRAVAEFGRGRVTKEELLFAATTRMPGISSGTGRAAPGAPAGQAGK